MSSDTDIIPRTYTIKLSKHRHDMLKDMAKADSRPVSNFISWLLAERIDVYKRTKANVRPFPKQVAVNNGVTCFEDNNS